MGRTWGRNFHGEARYAAKVGSLGDARAHGLRAVRRFRRRMASDQMSLARGEYGGDETLPFWHSMVKIC